MRRVLRFSGPHGVTLLRRLAALCAGAADQLEEQLATDDAALALVEADDSEADGDAA